MLLNYAKYAVLSRGLKVALRLLLYLAVIDNFPCKGFRLDRFHRWHRAKIDS